MSLERIFKAYDIRGAYPDDIDEDIVRRIGRAAAVFIGCRNALVGHDMRRSGPSLAAALIDGLRTQGVDVTFIGEAASPLVYYAGREFDAAISVTASHNPMPDNGMKICRRGALPIGSDSGLGDIRQLALAGRFPDAPRRGILVEASPRAAFLDFSLRALHATRPLRVVVDAGNGIGGPDYTELAARGTCLDIVPLYFEPDDTFPHHEANPLDFETLRDLQRQVVAERADFGVALDGDGDRCFFVDETGAIVPSDVVTALIAQDVLAGQPGATILYDLRSSRVVPEAILEAGGRPVECRVGHAFIKRQMREYRGVFAGELSGHFYFEASSYAENTFLALFRLANILDARGGTLSEAVRPLRRYAGSGEINSRVDAVAPILERLRHRYADGDVSLLDGLKVSYPDWWFNVRPSNTEPVLRLVVEARTPAEMERHRDELLSFIR